jgi:hypothetical protein
MNKHNSDTCDDENGNCRACGHPFNPHVVIAYDVNDLAKGGQMRCQVKDCDCLQTLNFEVGDKEWTKKLDSLLKRLS